jgi:DNA-binding transcriptional ArsR family regulator
MSINKEKQNVELLAKKLKVAGDSNRIRILCLIFSDRRACVSDISKDLNLSIATTSHHLQSLAKEGLLEGVREGKKICYSLSRSPLAKDLKKFICRYR